eukprot:TRINITY_DN111731_c0_g1_i1.p1 TRINITY_DN111731_c0_g1~~TRINITY_DN111731_c0_g1_i1.p1  ORF type:complete len:139 (-),score=33.60 TRINITY_DN111731_c0_g1_i1:269-685(-)
MKEQLSKHADWKDLVAFAPHVRGSVGLVRLDTTGNVGDFIREWQRRGPVYYKDVSIKAFRDSTPEERKMFGKLFHLREYLMKTFPDQEFDSDKKNACIWLGDDKLAKCCAESDAFVWDEQAATTLGVDRQAAQSYSHE